MLLIRSRFCEKSLCWMLSHTSAEYSARGLCKHRDKYSKIVWEKAHKLLSNRFLSFSKAWVVQEELSESCGCSHQCLTHTAITGLPPPSTFLPVGVCFDSKFTHSPWCVDVSGKKNARVKWMRKHDEPSNSPEVISEQITPRRLVGGGLGGLCEMDC